LLSLPTTIQFMLRRSKRLSMPTYGHHPKLDLLDLSQIDNPAVEKFATRLLQLQDTM
jgi:hypothetical protein